MASSSNLLPGVPLIESPLFAKYIETSGLNSHEVEIARNLNERGYAIVDFPDPEIHARMDRIKSRLSLHFGIDLVDTATMKHPGALRVQDAWEIDEDVRAIATNPGIVGLLSKLYGRPAFPFQTLNFPVGTQQHPHTDSIHFSSLPERFMCGVWLAFEDIHPEAGPLQYYPGSHRWPILSNAMIGRRGWQSQTSSAQTPFEAVWRAMVDDAGIQPELFMARKGQALIWAANLLHGGSQQIDPTKTRWSQVTHYYFKECIYYTPAYSDEPLGKLDLRGVTNINDGQIEPNILLGETATRFGAATKRWRPARALNRLVRALITRRPLGLPRDFDGQAYYKLNPDVAAAKDDPIKHFLKHGRYEGRKYKFGRGPQG